MQNKPQPYEIYRHFKGNSYQVLNIAKDSEDGSLQVVYQQLYSPFKVYVRPYDMFISPVDKQKYPEEKQKYRFELQDIQRYDDGEKNKENNKENKKISHETEYSNVVPVVSVVPRENEQYDNSSVDPMLMQFFDAETYEEKLRIFSAMHDRVTQSTINTIAAVLDIEVGAGELETRYDSVRTCLMTMERFECNRLR